LNYSVFPGFIIHEHLYNRLLGEALEIPGAKRTAYIIIDTTANRKRSGKMDNGIIYKKGYTSTHFFVMGILYFPDTGARILTRLGRLLYWERFFDKLMIRSDRWQWWENRQPREMCYATHRWCARDHKQWVSELERSRNIQWSGDWVRLDALASELRVEHPKTFRFMEVRCRNGETKEYWAFTKVVRLKRYGRKRLVIVRETSDLSDPPRYLLTSAKHWNSGRTIQTWSWGIKPIAALSQEREIIL